MKKQHTSMDGFVPRQRSGVVDKGRVMAHGSERRAHIETPKKVHAEAPQLTRRSSGSGTDIRQEIDDSLKDIDAPERDVKGKIKKTPEQKKRRKRIVKWVVWLIVLILLAVGGYVGIKAAIAGSKAFQGGLLGFTQKAKLKTDANGRTNVLVFGTSEDDEGGEHPGGELSDTIMMVSLDQQKKNAYMISMPRDMWVQLDAACDVGYESKINAVYMCSSENGANEAAGAQALQRKVGEVFGLDSQYYVHVNTSVVRDAVDAVGGITVKVETDNPMGVYDPNFDWQCNHQCDMVRYSQNEVANMDGAHALAFARARNAQGGYGLENGNFDREKNQQKVIKALQEKAISAGTLTNIGKITGLMDAMGANLRTNFETKEIRTLADLGVAITGDKLQTVDLTKEGESVVTTGDVGGQSVVRPITGLYDYSGIQNYIRKQISSDAVTKEAAEVAVLNGSGVSGAAQTEADKLEAKGFTIGAIDTAPEGDYGKAVIYQIGDGNTATKSRLEKTYGVKVSAGESPVWVPATTKFVVIIGASAQ